MPRKPKRFDVVTLFPAACQGYTDASIIGRAQTDKLVEVSYWQPRDFAVDKNHRIDQKPYGGGPGMVLEAEPFISAWHAAKGRRRKVKTIFFSPHGQVFDQKMAQDLARDTADLIFLCGRYEGIDERAREITDAIPISTGPYVLTGGELPALTMIDAIVRQIPGVLGTYESLEELRVASPKVYTRPEVIKYKGKEYRVPNVLLTGNHKYIDEWRSQQSYGQ